MTTATQTSRRHGKTPSSGEFRALPSDPLLCAELPSLLGCPADPHLDASTPVRCECQESVSEMPRVPEGGVSKRGRDFHRQGRESAGEGEGLAPGAWETELETRPPTVPVGGSLVLMGRQRASSGNPGDGVGIPAAAPMWAGCPGRDLRRHWRHRGPFRAQRPLGASPPWTDGGRGPFVPDHAQQEPDWEINEGARGARNEGTWLCQ